MIGLRAKLHDRGNMGGKGIDGNTVIGHVCLWYVSVVCVTGRGRR